MRCMLCNSKGVTTTTRFDYGGTVTVFNCPNCKKEIGAIGFIPKKKKKGDLKNVLV